MNIGLADKVVIITGGAGGIGSATAKCFLEEGAVVILGDINHSKGEEIKKSLHQLFPEKVFFYPLNLRDETQVRAFVRLVVDYHGGIDVIVNNAASFFFDHLINWDSLEPLDQHYQIGLRGPMTLVQESWRIFPQSRAGSVINISSVAGHIGEPKAMAYTALKAAQKGFTLSCAMEMAEYGGWAISISPGHTWTLVHQKRANAMGLSRKEYENSQSNIQSTMYGRFLEAKEVGEWIVMAASRLGKPLTGQDIKVTLGIEAGGFNRNYQTS